MCLSISYSLFQNSLQYLVVVVRSKGVSLALKELVLEFNPVQSDRVKEALKGVHQHQYS